MLGWRWVVVISPKQLPEKWLWRFFLSWFSVLSGPRLIQIYGERLHCWLCGQDWKTMRWLLPIVSPVPQNYGEALVRGWSMWPQLEEWTNVLLANLIWNSWRIFWTTFYFKKENMSLSKEPIFDHMISYQSHNHSMVPHPQWEGREAVQKPAKTIEIGQALYIHNNCFLCEKIWKYQNGHWGSGGRSVVWPTTAVLTITTTRWCAMYQ